MVKYALYLLYFSLLAFVISADTSFAGQFYLFDLLNSLKLQLTVVLLLLASTIVIFNKWLGVFLIGFSVFYALLSFHFSSHFTAPSARQFTVNQHNLNYSNPFITQIFNNELKPLSELTILFEVNDTKRQEFIELRGDYFDYGSTEIEGFPDGIGVISKYPILKRIQHRVFKNTEKGVIIELHLAIADQLLRLFAFHPPSPRNKELWHRRNQMMAHLMFLVNKSTHLKHTLVVADFNTPPWSHYFPNQTTLTSCYQHAGHYTSWEPSTTHGALSSILSIPIDNCLLSESLSLSNFKTIKRRGSDHFQLRYDVNIR